MFHHPLLNLFIIRQLLHFLQCLVSQRGLHAPVALASGKNQCEHGIDCLLAEFIILQTGQRSVQCPAAANGSQQIKQQVFPGGIDFIKLPAEQYHLLIAVASLSEYG